MKNKLLEKIERAKKEASHDIQSIEYIAEIIYKMNKEKLEKLVEFLDDMGFKG